jgi:excisionase family DNA binding protein
MTIDDATREILRIQAATFEQSAKAIYALIEPGQITRWYGVNEYAQLTGTSRSTVQRQLLAHQIPGATKHGNQWRIPVKETAA